MRNRVGVRGAGGAALLLAALPALALLGGCLFSTEDDPPAQTPVVDDLCDTPDELVTAFHAAYAGRDLDGYGALLHPGFRFLFKPEDAISLPDDVFTRDEELAVSANLFSGQPRPQPDGPPVPGITGITISVLNRKTAWAPVAPADTLLFGPASQQATFEVEMRIDRDQGSLLIVAGETIFYAASRDSLVSGVVKPYFQLRGQRDLTRSSGGKRRPAEDTSWGWVKIMYQ